MQVSSQYHSPAFFNCVGESRFLSNGTLVGVQQAIWTFLEEKKYLPLIRLELRISQPVAISLYWPHYFYHIAEWQGI